MRTDSPASRYDTLGLTVSALYTLAAEAAGTAPASGNNAASLAGHKFEDDAARAAYEMLTKRGISPSQPRYTLHLPTLSGLKQQFDVVVHDGHYYYPIELKRRTHSEIEQLYAFVAKLIDYALAARVHDTGHAFTGIFVSTAGRLNDNFRRFAMTYGVIPIARDLPPCQVLSEKTKNANVRADATDLARRLNAPLPGALFPRVDQRQSSVLLVEWKSIFQRFEQDDRSSA